MSRISVFAVLTAAAAVASAGEKQPISGSVNGGLSAGEYIVKSVIVVPEGESLNLQAGTTLYFEQLTGIDVRGELSADGTPDAPVVLTSVNDTAGSAEPAQAFDWNGIKAEGPAASVSLRHARVSHSVYGVSFRDPKMKAELAGVVFQNNGYASVAVGERIVPVTAGEPFSERWNIDAPEPGQPAKKPARNSGGASRARLIFNASALGAAAVGVTIYTVSLTNTNTYFKHYAQDGNSNRLSAYYEGKIRGSITMGAVGAVMAGVGLSCVGVSLFF
jgi:hypothetical protein